MPNQEIGGKQGGIIAALLPDAGDQRVGGRVGELVEPALQRGGRCLGTVPGCADALVPEEALQVGDVHSQREQARSQRVPQQMRIDAFGVPGGGHPADDLAHTLPVQRIQCRPGPVLPAGEKRPSSAGTDVQPEQLRQVTPDRHLAALATPALADRDHALGEADVLDPELDQLGRAGAGFQQGLQHQPDPAVLGVSLVEEAQLLLDRQPVHAVAALGCGVQAGPRPGGFKHGLALGVVDALADEHGGDGSGTRHGGQDAACLSLSGAQIRGIGTAKCARVCQRAPWRTRLGFPLRHLWKARRQPPASQAIHARQHPAPDYQ